MGGWKWHKMEMEEKANVRMLELTIEYKKLQRKLVDQKNIVQKECQELKNKEEAWNETEQQYQKTMIDYRHKKEGWEMEKELQVKNM